MVNLKRLHLKRKTTSQLKVSGASGKKKTVNVEVRKKRTYVKRSEVDASEQAETVDEAALAVQKAEEVRVDRRAKSSRATGCRTSG